MMRAKLGRSSSSAPSPRRGSDGATERAKGRRVGRVLNWAGEISRFAYMSHLVAFGRIGMEASAEGWGGFVLRRRAGDELGEL
jgi:hypothetical protein